MTTETYNPNLIDCPDCGRGVSRRAISCPECGGPINRVDPPPTVVGVRKFKSRGIYLLLALTVGWFGVHNFYAGHRTPGVIQLVVTIIGIFLILPLFITFIWILRDLFEVKVDGDGQPMLWRDGGRVEDI